MTARCRRTRSSPKKRRSRPAPSAGRAGATRCRWPSPASDGGGLGLDQPPVALGDVGGQAGVVETASSPARSAASTIVPLAVSSSWRVPCARIRPPPMIIIRSATASTSPSRCEESSTVPPRSAKPRSRPRIQRIPSGSRPLAGSSRIRTSGSPSSACANPRRWRIPSEYCPTRRRAAAASRPTCSSSASTRASGTPIVLARDGQRLAPAAPGVLRRGVEQDPDPPARVRQLAIAPAEDPRLRYRARTGRRASAASCVLPAPLGPRKPVTVPGSQRNVTSETTARSPRRLVTPST